jgi:hypothetical protein
MEGKGTIFVRLCNFSLSFSLYLKEKKREKEITLAYKS